MDRLLFMEKTFEQNKFDECRILFFCLFFEIVVVTFVVYWQTYKCFLHISVKSHKKLQQKQAKNDSTHIGNKGRKKTVVLLLDGTCKGK